ncbi:hypothetical protein C3K47_00470 [Solitalea longa]|uniref:Uncharacterized protein n=1 Tax=Solitalea longa TaxID=2079460 RepID=A0A2S5A9P3_9SPHI|nr:hypothetical protein [Solitalea longa]POY39009.1 hypothetical protein C3K47_00470 [Solitalea longa]
MKQAYVTISFLSALFLVSCNQEKPATVAVAPADQAKNAMIVNNLRAAQNAQKVVSNTSKASSVSVPSSQNFGQSPGVNPVNPAHGQPGHRCDIPVGASLSTPAQMLTSNKSQGTQPSNGTAPSVKQANVQAPITTATKPGMNPPHGQRGHRCDIAVGAPLNSKPKTAAVNQSNSAAPVSVSSQPQTVPAPVSAITPEGMNPPHGQPGHRCDIAVGAPLPKN